MSRLRRKQIDLILSQGPTDGVYGSINSANISNTDVLEDAFDKVVTILDALVPPAAPNLSSMSESPSGVTGKLSFGASNTVVGYNNAPTDINTTYTAGGTTVGIINATTNLTGTLANTTTQGSGTPNAAYPANAFGNADQGTLQLKLNGTVIQSVNLSSFASGTSNNANGSGFTLSAATAVVFPQGTTFPTFKYRTGTWTLNQAEWATTSKGYNTVQVVHSNGANTYSTQTYNFIVDGNTATITASSPSLGSLSMAGSRYISGVQYHQSGTAQYGVTLSGVYPYTYSSSASAISFVTTNAAITSQAIPNLTTNQNDNVVLSGKTATISTASRLLGASVSVSTSVARTVQTTVTGLGSQTAFSLLLDTISTGSSDTAEQFNTETYRMTNAIESNKDNTSGYATGGTNPYAWDATQSLTTGTSTHTNGLLVFNGKVQYPTNTTGTGITSGNFSTVTNGPVNPDYSGATGNRVYYRYYYRPSQSNFVMQVTATSTTFVSSATSPSGNNLNIEILAPSQTKNGSSVTEWKDCVTSYTADSAIGAYNASGGSNVGSISGANWGLTIGTKTTANSGNVIILRITASSSWTGSIDTINIS